MTKQDLRGRCFPIAFLGSGMLWAAGGLWFLLCFSVLSPGLAISIPRRLFPLVRALTRALLRVVGAFKMGSFHLAKAAGADIVPFAVSGLFRFQPRGRFLLRPGPVSVVFGGPIRGASVLEMSPAELRDKIRSEIERLLQLPEARLYA